MVTKNKDTVMIASINTLSAGTLDGMLESGGIGVVFSKHSPNDPHKVSGILAEIEREKPVVVVIYNSNLTREKSKEACKGIAGALQARGIHLVVKDRCKPGKISDFVRQQGVTYFGEDTGDQALASAILKMVTQKNAPPGPAAMSVR